MPKQQRMMRVEQRSQLAAIQQLESRSDEELEAENRYKVAAQAILGARAAERYDAKAARAHFQRAMAAARPQERMQLRRMADASLALAERRADDLKKATERLGMDAPTSRQLRGLQFMGLIAPPASAGALARVRGILLIILLVILVLALGFGIVYGIGSAAGRIPFERFRCLIVADGFYEWQDAAPGAKRAFHITRADGELFAFAGLWSTWRSESLTVRSCAILTAEANAAVAPLHDRMPVILDRD